MKVFLTCLLVLSTLLSQSSALAQDTQLLIRVAPPAGETAPVRLRQAELLLAWWGGYERLSLDSRYENDQLLIEVPLAARVLAGLGYSDPPEFAKVYLDFEQFVPVQSERFAWPGGRALDVVGAATELRFAFVGHSALTLPFGTDGEVTLVPRRAEPRQLRVVDTTGLPVNDIRVWVYSYWASNNHCGTPVGIVDLLQGEAPDAAGILPLPDGDLEYAIAVTGPHLKVSGQQYRNEPLITRLQEPELQVTIEHAARVPLRLQVTQDGGPAAGVLVSAMVSGCACGACGGQFGTTDENGLLEVEDFYPAEWEALCIGQGDDPYKPFWAATPPADGILSVDLPAGVQADQYVPCYLPR